MSAAARAAAADVATVAARVAGRRIETALGRLTHHAWRPAPDDPLAPFVERIVDCDGEVAAPRERLFPTGAIELVVHLDEPARELTPRGARRYPVACLTGIREAPVVMAPPPGRARIVAVRLRPAGARALLARPLAEVSGRTVDLRDALGGAAGELAEACEEGRTAAARIAIARAWLAARARHAGRDGEVAAWAVARIERARGALPIDALRDGTGLGWARLAALFREQVGVTPKRYARIVRFGHALSLLRAAPARALSAVALDAGYYDQAHMAAEFRALGGVAPSALRSSAWYPESESVAEPPVRRGRNLQDAAAAGV